MNIKNLFFKKLKVPATNELKEVDAVQLWQVEWTSRYDSFSSSTEQEFEVFTSEELANEFANSLRAAFKLLRYTGDETYVKVIKRS